MEKRGLEALGQVGGAGNSDGLRAICGCHVFLLLREERSGWVVLLWEVCTLLALQEADGPADPPSALSPCCRASDPHQERLRTPALALLQLKDRRLWLALEGILSPERGRGHVDKRQSGVLAEFACRHWQCLGRETSGIHLGDHLLKTDERINMATGREY